jgi:hypothetical protein
LVVLFDERVERMTITLLSFDGCPHVESTLTRIRAALRAEGVHATIERVEVDSPEEAVRHGFLGSPSVRVNGRDIEPGADARLDYGLACRTYASPGGIEGTPSHDLIRAALQGS